MSTNSEKEIKIVILNRKLDDLIIKNRKLSTELIEVKQEKSHNEQLLDAFQNVLADFGYKLEDINE